MSVEYNFFCHSSILKGFFPGKINDCSFKQGRIKTLQKKKFWTNNYIKDDY